MTIGSVNSNAPSSTSEVSNLGQTSADQARIDQAMTFFMEQGWTREQAAGIVGNLWAESQVRHDQAQHGGGPGYGLAQWEGPRQASFQQWAGHDIHDSTMQEQLEFIQWELNNTEQAAGNALRDATTADQAARIVMTRYERPADQSEGAQRGRAAYANDIYANAGGTPGTQPDPVPDPDPAPQPDPGNAGSVTVQRGDTLSGIAQRNGVSLPDLLAANPQIRNPNLIYPGQTVHLPDGAASTYTVQGGDTLSGIAQRNGTSLPALLDANPQFRSNPDLIHPGQTVAIPGGGSSSGGPAPAPAPAPAPTPDGDAPTYDPYTVYSTGHQPAIAVSNPDQLQPHHDYTTRNREGQTLEVRDIVLHREGQSQEQQAIPAPIAGEVIHAGPMGDAGNAVILRGERGELTYIFHMSSIDVRVGQDVAYGQDLGNQGTTGHSTGPHIHIEAAPEVIDRWVDDLLDGRFDGRRG